MDTKLKSGRAQTRGGLCSTVAVCLDHNGLYPNRLGGPDPLDYVSMYANMGRSTEGIPPHWHYVSFGLSDLHGDGRVHE